jgi:hypothetical protein
MKTCPQCGANAADHVMHCPVCGSGFFAEAVNPAAAIRSEPAGDATGGIIPYKNPAALFAYYLGIASGLPLIGLPLGIAAFVLGIMGLQARRRNPAIKGSVHAGIGIGCGCLFTVFWSVVLVAMIAAMVSRPS